MGLGQPGLQFGSRHGQENACQYCFAACKKFRWFIVAFLFFLYDFLYND